MACSQRNNACHRCGLPVSSGVICFGCGYNHARPESEQPVCYPFAVSMYSGPREDLTTTLLRGTTVLGLNYGRAYLAGLFFLNAQPGQPRPISQGNVMHIELKVQGVATLFWDIRILDAFGAICVIHDSGVAR